jgi:hypothetical protein
MTTTLATLSGLEVGTTFTCSLNATTPLALTCASSHISQFSSLYIFRFRCSSCSPSFHNLLCPTTPLKRKRRNNFPGAYQISRHRWAVDGSHLFCIFFFCFIFNNDTLSDNMGLAWFGRGGRFPVTFFLSSPLHHITAGCSKVKKQTKSWVFWKDRGFSERGIFSRTTDNVQTKSKGELSRWSVWTRCL